MLSLGKFPTVCDAIYIQNFQFPVKSHFSFSAKNLNIRSFGKKRTGFCSNAVKTKKNDDFSALEMEGPDEFKDNFDDEFIDIESDGEFEGDDEDGEEVDMPLGYMKKWLENKPRGFGEGKAYDTSIEDKLMEEIEHSRKAQLANINKLKNNPPKSPSKEKQNEKGKASVTIQDGVRVCLVNLPKKKNIHRDLQLAFKGVPGILNIIPAVSGHKRTRDPICKGIAFIYFKSEKEAYRFVQNFSGQSISFGKVQKQIKCNLMTSNSSSLVSEQSEHKTDCTAGQAAISRDEESDSDVDTNDNLLAFSDGNFFSEYDDEDERYVSAEWEVSHENFETSSHLEFATIQPSSKKGRRPKVNGKKVASKRKTDKIPKLQTLGSANRLKIREKAVLKDVFSKYRANATLAVEE